MEKITTPYWRAKTQEKITNLKKTIKHLESDVPFSIELHWLNGGVSQIKNECTIRLTIEVLLKEAKRQLKANEELL